MDYYEIFSRYNVFSNDENKETKKLIIVLGSLGDFDSFEYAQNLHKQLDRLRASLIDYKIIGLGNNKSKLKFCDFISIPVENVFIFSNNDIHRELGLNKGLQLPLPALINILLMCLGVRSPGTLKEVIRGYTGDSKAANIYSKDDNIKIGKIGPFKGSLFEFFNTKEELRPFELATKRLTNMIEIITYWHEYTPYNHYLIQRGGTFLFDKNYQLIYNFRPTSILGYSDQMDQPLSFLDRHLV